MATDGNDGPLLVHGVVANVEQRGFSKDWSTYHVVLVPRAWALTLTFRSRIFQQMTVPDVIERVLDEGGLGASDYRLELTGQYAVREFIAQFQETDWDFLSRWMERLGIFYYFEPGDGREVLVLRDDSAGCPPIGISGPVTFHADTGALTDTAGAATVRSMSYREQVGTGRVVLNDYNYRSPHTNLMAEAEANRDMPGVLYEYGTHHKDPGEGARLARVRGEELEARRRVLSGGGNVLAFRAGHTFEFEPGDGHRADLRARWLLTGVEHHGSQESGLSPTPGYEGGARYSNAFHAIPAATPYRPPRRTPVPRPSIMTAVTETAGGEYAHIDDEGRYRARIHWDLGDASEAEASKWVRMKQPYAGADYGHHFPNHAGAEMLVAFVNGDPDRPLALGTVPHPSQRSPSTARNRAHNLIRTWGGNELLMDDTTDEQQVRLSSDAKNTVLLDDKDDRIVITTTNGHTLTFDDANKNVRLVTTDGHEALFDDENRAITVTSKDGHSARIDDENEQIAIRDADGKHTFLIDIGAERVVIRTETGDIGIQAPDGHIGIESKSLSIHTTQDTEILGMNVAVEAKVGATTKAPSVTSEGSATHTIKGGVVRIN